VAASADDATVDVLRQANFYAGGVANVALLGVFVLGTALALSRDRLFGGGTRWFGLIAGSLAALSVISLAFYYASVLLPVGRLLCMIWTIVAAVVILRRVRAESR
jgi:type IV secretory pathway TrbD component